jgi:DNA-binding NarL/FixJ family response regulator
MRMQPTKVLIVDDHALLRRGVRNTIEPQEDFEVLGEAEDGMEALAKARDLKPDLILMDTVYDEDENLFEAIKRGAEGFLSKKVRAKALLDSLRDLMRGETAISKPIAEKIL